MIKRCLILTGTVDAGNDCFRRRKEYMQAIEFYGQHLTADIFFAENSGYDIKGDGEFSETLEKYNVKVLEMTREKNESKGKGYQEFSMLDRFVDNFCEKYDSFAKITGRYIVKNVENLFYLPCEGMVVDRHAKMKVAITGFFICEMEFYKKELKNAYKKADDEKGYFIEHVLYEILNNTAGKARLFPKNPLYTGRSGSYGGSLHRNPLKMKIRNLERKILKGFGKNEFLIEY